MERKTITRRRRKEIFVSRECIVGLLRADVGVSNRGSRDEVSYTS